MWKSKVKQAIGGLALVAAPAFAHAPHGGGEETADIKVSKTIRLDFKANSDVQAKIANKYGNISLFTWAKDSAKMEVEITAKGLNEAEANKILERVQVVYRYQATYLDARTDIAPAAESPANNLSKMVSGLVNNLTSSFGSGGSKPAANSSTPIDQHNLQVNYRLYLPANALANIEHKYGNVAVAGHYKGKLQVDLSHGDLRIEQQVAKAEVHVNFGNLMAKHIQGGYIEVKYGSMHLQQGGELSLVGSSSTLRLDSVASLQLDSRNDKLDLGGTGKLRGKTYLTQLAIAQLAREAVLETQLGEVRIRQLRPSFSLIDFKGRGTRFEVESSGLPDLSLNILARKEAVQVPDRLAGSKEAPPDMPGYVRLSASTGTARRQVQIEARDGEVLIR